MLGRIRERVVVERVRDYSGAERAERFLEGTDAMVLDHVHGIAFACRARRLDPRLFREVCTDLGDSAVLLEAADAGCVAVHHMNVLMSVGMEVALVGTSRIRDDLAGGRVLASLQDSGRDVMELSEPQVRGVLGKCLDLRGGEEKVLAMSTRAAQLRSSQRRGIERSCRILARAHDRGDRWTGALHARRDPSAAAGAGADRGATVSRAVAPPSRTGYGRAQL